jgi:hypothetical protein
MKNALPVGYLLVIVKALKVAKQNKEVAMKLNPFSNFMTCICVVAIVLMYAAIQQMDNDAQIEAAAHKAETIAAAKEEFLREKRYGKLAAVEKELERMTFPLEAYNADYNRK